MAHVAFVDEAQFVLKEIIFSVLLAQIYFLEPIRFVAAKNCRYS